MNCLALGCKRPARGDVDTIDVHQIWVGRVVRVPAHFCRYCEYHECELEVFLLNRAEQ